MENQRLASEKQIAYLKKLGYTGDTTNLSPEDASALINQMSNGAKPTTTKNQVASTNNTPVKHPAFSNFMATVGVKLVANAIKDEKRKVQFIANLVSAVSANPLLQECEPTSVISAGLQADALHFPINNQLGYCYPVPYNDKKTGMKKCQLQIGYKGYIQMAIRSGQYLNIDVAEVKEGELKKWSPLKVDIDWKDYEERKNLKTIGYVGEFVLINGFTKSFYMSYEQMIDHADTYSQAFDRNDYEKLQKGEINQKDMWKYSSFWYKSFDEMAKKTILRQLISKWGIMSVEMQQAFENDMASFELDGRRTYVDSKEVKNDSLEDVIAEQININASESFDVVDDETGEVNNDADNNLFGEFINSK